MSKLPFLALSLLITGICRSQALSPATVGGSGNILVPDKRILSFTANNLSMPAMQISADSAAIHGLGAFDNSENSDKNGGLAVYPNPAVDNLWFAFQLPGKGKVNVSLYNCLGQKMQDINYSDYDNTKVVEQLDVSLLPAGNYLLSLKFTNSKGQASQILNRKFQVIN